MTETAKQDSIENLCSYEKGIINKLNENQKIINILMAKYIVANNSKWNSNDFPSSQIAKVILKLLKKDIHFPIMHRMVKEILKIWEKEKICKYITTTKFGHCRKTKDIYRFEDEGIKRLKEMLIHYNIDLIKGKENNAIDLKPNEEIMKPRDNLILEIRYNYEEILYNYINTHSDFEG